MKKYSGKDDFLKHRYDPVGNRTIYYDNDARIDRIVSQLKRSNRSVNLLDVGCYDGYIAAVLKRTLGPKCQAYGVDIAQNTVTLAKKNGVHATIADVSKKLPYKDNTFDYLLAGEIIEHIYDTDSFIEELKRVTKPGGTIILTTPNSLSLGRRLHYLIGSGIFLEVSFTIPDNAAGHIRYFTFGTMRRFAVQHGLDIYSIGSDSVTLPFGIKIRFLARLIPGFGQHIIVFLKKKKKKAFVRSGM